MQWVEGEGGSAWSVTAVFYREAREDERLHAVQTDSERVCRELKGRRVIWLLLRSVRQRWGKGLVKSLRSHSPGHRP